MIRSLSYCSVILQSCGAVEIDFSKPKCISKVSTPDHASSIVSVDATQPSEDNLQTFFQKLVTNSKSTALLSVSIPASEPNLLKYLGDLYSKLWPMRN